MRIAAIALGLLFSPLVSQSQITFNTTPPLTANNGASGITFQLTANEDITVRSFNGVSLNSSISPMQIWYSATDLTGRPDTISTANGWVELGSATFRGQTDFGGVPVVEEFPIDVNLFMPAGTTYRYFIGGPRPASVRYTNGGGVGVFTDGNVTFTTGGDVGYAGSFPDRLGIPDRAFTGGVNYTLTPIPDPFIITNSGAIQSLESTGFLMGFANRTTTRNASSVPLGLLRHRIFDVKARKPTGEGFRVNASQKVKPTSRYLNFMAKLGVDYRVALGLMDETEVPIGATVSSARRQDGKVEVEGPFALTDTAAGGKTSPLTAAPSRFETYTQFDFGFYDQDALSTMMRGFDTDSYAGSLGLDYVVTETLIVGTAFSYLESDTHVGANLGGIDLDGIFLSAYATATFGNAWLDLSYTYGDLENDLTRNTLLGSTAFGETDSYSENVELSLGQNFGLSDEVSFGPTLNLGFATGKIDGYTERGGGAANLVLPEDDFESLISRLGGHVTYRRDTEFGRMTVQGTAAWAHEHKPEGDRIAASLQSSPFTLVTPTSPTSFRTQSVGGFTSSGASPAVGTDWLELGVATRLDFRDSWHLLIGYDGMLGRNNASAHFGTVRLGFEW